MRQIQVHFRLILLKRRLELVDVLFAQWKLLLVSLVAEDSLLENLVFRDFDFQLVTNLIKFHQNLQGNFLEIPKAIFKIFLQFSHTFALLPSLKIFNCQFSEVAVQNVLNTIFLDFQRR